MTTNPSQPNTADTKPANTFGDDMEKNLFSVFEKPVKRERGRRAFRCNHIPLISFHPPFKQMIVLRT